MNTIFFHAASDEGRFMSNYYQSYTYGRKDRHGRKPRYAQPQLTIGVQGQPFTFNNAEAAFHALKQSPYDLNTIGQFTTLSGSEARALGRSVPLRVDWDDVRIPLMLHILRAKFSNPGLMQELQDTGTSYLVHQAPWDNFWGNGRDQRGTNQLGKLLMAIREMA